MNKKTAEELFMQLQETCHELGWVVAFEDIEDHVAGVIVGTKKYVKHVLSQVDDPNNFEVWEKETTKKGDTIH